MNKTYSVKVGRICPVGHRWPIHDLQLLLQYYVTHYEYGEDPDIYKDAVEIIAPQTRKDLKPCPFCGGEARVETVYEGYSYAVECTNCMVRMEGADTEAQAIACWNRRI